MVLVLRHTPWAWRAACPGRLCPTSYTRPGAMHKLQIMPAMLVGPSLLTTTVLYTTVRGCDQNESHLLPNCARCSKAALQLCGIAGKRVQSCHPSIAHAPLLCAWSSAVRRPPASEHGVGGSVRQLVANVLWEAVWLRNLAQHHVVA